MSITLKHNEAPIFPKVKFDCDEPIHKKLDKYELSREFLNESGTLMICGRPKSGKTSLTINFIQNLFKKVYHHIYLFMPKTSRDSLHNNIFDKHLDPSQLYEELNMTTLKDVEKNLIKNTAKKEWSLVIFDDVQSALKNANLLKTLEVLVANHRHYRVSNLILLQNFVKFPKQLRSIANNLILFKMPKTQMETIFTELIEIDKDYFDDIMDLVYDKPKQWMFINIESQRIFKEWDEILLEDDSDNDSDSDDE